MNKTRTAKSQSNIKKLCFSSMFLALALVLPFLTGQIPSIGSALCPMHIPVLLCGFVCGWPWGLVVGFVAPLLRFLLFSMPPIFPTGLSMAFELAVYGCATGLLYRVLPKKIPYIYVNLFISMVLGRLAWGAVRFLIAGLGKSDFSFAMFWAGAVADALPGIIVQIVIIPLLVIVFKRAGLLINERT